MHNHRLRNIANSGVQLHTDNPILVVQFRKWHAPEQKQCTNCSSQKLQRENTRAHTFSRHTSIRTCQQANPSSLFLPRCAHIFLVAAPCSQNIYFCWFFSWGNTKEITPFFLPGSCQNNQCFPERDLWCDMRGGKAEGCRHSSGALVVDNKWGAVLGYVLQLSRLIIFDMHSGVYTVSSVKSSPAIEGNRARGAHTTQRIHILHTEVLRKEEPVVAFAFSPSFPLFSMSHLLSTAQLAALAPVSWLTSCSRWLMKKSWLLGFRGCFPINMNSPWSSCNIRPGPVFVQQAARSFVCNTQEEMKRVNSPFRMLHLIMGGTKSPMKGTSIFGSPKHICFPSPDDIIAWFSAALISVSCFTVDKTVQFSVQRCYGCLPL